MTGRPLPSAISGGLTQLPAFDRLSPREREVLDGIVKGLTNRAIGQALGISHRTVEIHRAHIMRKLNASSFASLIAIALGQQPAGRALHHGESDVRRDASRSAPSNRGGASGPK
nr:LuxR C-terminal-related transcriptional regulator [Sphingomonas lycopersici]